MFSAEYSYSLQLEASREDGRREGIEEGRAEERAGVIKAMKSKGFSVKDIADILSIQEEKVESMK